MDRFSPVLLVSSSEELRVRLAGELAEEGILLFGATGIDEALTVLAAREPALALLSVDVNEHEDGLEVARALRARRSVPIAFLADGIITATVGTRLAMVPHLGVFPQELHGSFIREMIRRVRYGRHPEDDRATQDASLSEWRAQLIEGILHLSPNAVVVLDENHLILDWNPAATRLFGYTRSEVVGRQIDDLIVVETDRDRREEAREYTRRALARETVDPTETVRYRKDGSAVDVILAGEPIHVGGDFVGVVAYYQDIGPVVEARRRVEELLREKEILLGEVQHRVKNDIALIESMLSLQASRYESPAMREAITDAINRIASVRSVYDALHRFRGIDRVGAQALVENLMANYRDVLAERDVVLETAIDEIILPTGAAISVGLVVNELLTNVVKYAFPPGREIDPRRVRVGVTNHGDGRITIAVEDTGVGLPSDDGGGGYGLTFVRAIAEQYRGEARFSDDGGTRAEVTFNVPPPARDRERS